jgi:hypothetical protein
MPPSAGGLPSYRVLSHTSGADFESGEAHRRRGVNEEAPRGDETESAGTGTDAEPRGFGAAGTGLGLQQRATGREVPKLPARDTPPWKCVEIINETNNAHTPKVKCKFCGWTRTAGSTLITEHVLCVGGATERCTAKWELELLAQVRPQLEAQRRDKEEKRAEKRSNEDSDARSSQEKMPAASGSRKFGAGTVAGMFDAKSKDEIDTAIADFFYGCNIDFSVADHELWRAAVDKIKQAPPSYKPPPKARIGNKLLEARMQFHLKEQNSQMMGDIGYGLTIVSDGWDSFDSEHLINLLAIGRTGTYFLGTVELTADSSENARAVCDTIISGLLRVGMLNVVLILTDTCSTMKAAWVLIEAKVPWITCGPCLPHVLNLLLKDLAKAIPEMQATIDDGSKIVGWFTNKKVSACRLTSHRPCAAHPLLRPNRPKHCDA